MKTIKSIGLAAIVLACFLFDSISAEAAIIRTYYPNGRLRSVTLTPPDGPDQYGNVYYYYLNDNWKGQGYGRVSKTRRQTPLNGELSYAFCYYPDRNGRLWIKTAYSDLNWRVLVAKYLYRNENWNNQGYGRIDRSSGKTAQNGELSHTYTYYSDAAGRMREKKAYSDLNWTKLVITYVYYNDNMNLLKSKTLRKADAFGNIRYEYLDENFLGRGYGRLSRIVHADGSYEVMEYWSALTELVRSRETYDASGNLIERFEYLGDGVSRRMVKETNGYHSYTYNNVGLVTETDSTGAVKVFNYDGSVFTGYTRMYETASGIRIKEEYDSDYRLVAKYEMNRPFFSGVNLPWLNYGKDIGISRFDNIAHGYSTVRGELNRRMSELSGSVTRVFLLNDLRSGINLDTNGNIIGFDDQSVRDLRALLDAAEANGVKLVLTLFDYLLADGVSSVTYWNGYTYVTEPLGEYPQFITDAAKRAQLVNAVKDLFNRAGLNDYRSVTGFDVMNEPEWSHDWGGVSYNDLRSFVYDFRDMLHANFAGKFVTLGSKDRNALLANWGSGLDVYQFHHYDWMNYNGLQLDYPAANLNLDHVVFAGELEPDAFNDKLMTLYENGYEGGLFWQDTGYYFISRDDLRALLNWFVGTTYEYYGSGKLKSKALANADANGNIKYEYIDENFHGRTYGRLSKIVKSDNSYELFTEYWGDTEQVKTKQLYGPAGNLIETYHYDKNGNCQPAQLAGVDPGYIDTRPNGGKDPLYGPPINQPTGYPDGIPVHP